MNDPCDMCETDAQDNDSKRNDESSRPAGSQRSGIVIKDPQERIGRYIRLALPVSNGVIAHDFHACGAFAVYEIDQIGRTVVKSSVVIPPRGRRNRIPEWLAGEGVQLVIADCIGLSDLSDLHGLNLEVIFGVTAEKPGVVVQRFLGGGFKLDGKRRIVQ